MLKKHHWYKDGVGLSDRKIESLWGKDRAVPLPPDLIEKKREQILLRRLAREMKAAAKPEPKDRQ